MPLYASAETYRERACIVFEQVDTNRWGKLLLHCTTSVPRSKAKLVQLEQQYGLSMSFREDKRLDLFKAHQWIANKPLKQSQLDIILNAMRTVHEKIESDDAEKLEAEILEGLFFQFMLTLNYSQLVRLIPRLRRIASNLTNFPHK